MNSIYDLDGLALLKDKLQSWPGEMCLVHDDVVNLIYAVNARIINEQSEAAERKAKEEK